MNSLEILNDNHCFCCGIKNEKGLKLSFDTTGKDTAITTFTIPEYFTGWANLTHGGFISMLLDETMAQACMAKDLKGVTAELTVRFIKPVPVTTEIIVTGKVEELRKRIALTTGVIRDREGTTYAEGKAKFIRTL